MTAGRAETREYFVPGRIELVGKHVDYAGGRSLTVATELAIRARATTIPEPVIRLRRGAKEMAMDVQLSPNAKATSLRSSAYVTAVARRFARDFPHARNGVSIELQSNLPTSAGLSSSTALVVTLALAFVDANDLTTDERWRAAIPTPMAFAEYVAAIETGEAYADFPRDGGVGVRGGAQDHVAIVCAEEGRVGQFRYLPAQLERRIAWPDDMAIAIAVSGVHATKTGNAKAAYNRLADAMRTEDRGPKTEDRRPRTEDGTRDVAERRAQFREEVDVIVPGVGDAIRDRDWARLGVLVDRSQALAESVLGNQVPETVHLARVARAQGAVAASAFGAGFGGAVWAMVPRAYADGFLASWRADYERAFPAKRSRAKWSVTRPAGPARRVR
ncbi:MAG: galactokinase family protein [Gemmatimonadaceae bacterium]